MRVQRNTETNKDTVNPWRNEELATHGSNRNTGGAWTQCELRWTKGITRIKYTRGN